jgi:hypothetical protein
MYIETKSVPDARYVIRDADMEYEMQDKTFKIYDCGF